MFCSFGQLQHFATNCQLSEWLYSAIKQLYIVISKCGCMAYHYWKLIPVIWYCFELLVDSDQWYSHLNCMCMYEDTQ